MGQRYLIDSNSVIDFLNSSLPKTGIDLLLNVEPVISIISQIEIFSKQNIPPNELEALNAFVVNSIIYPVDETIAIKTIALRSVNKIKLADAIIAATALHYKLTLITHNTSDFINIKGLRLIDPYKA